MKDAIGFFFLSRAINYSEGNIARTKHLKTRWAFRPKTIEIFRANKFVRLRIESVMCTTLVLCH